MGEAEPKLRTNGFEKMDSESLEVQLKWFAAARLHAVGRLDRKMQQNFRQHLLPEQEDNTVLDRLTKTTKLDSLTC